MQLVEMLKTATVHGKRHERGAIVDASSWGKNLLAMIKIGRCRYYVPTDVLAQTAQQAGARATKETAHGASKSSR